MTSLQDTERESGFSLLSDPQGFPIDIQIEDLFQSDVLWQHLRSHDQLADRASARPAMDLQPGEVESS
jgi:hypothetical protein